MLAVFACMRARLYPAYHSALLAQPCQYPCHPATSTSLLVAFHSLSSLQQILLTCLAATLQSLYADAMLLEERSRDSRSRREFSEED